MEMYRRFGKRFLDVVLSFLGIIILSPLFIVLSVISYYANKGVVFFVQERPGRYNRPFKVMKFQSMNNLCDEKGELLPDEKRVTSIGRFMRKTSLDELPQLFNVLIGDMSIIGPRPLLLKDQPERMRPGCNRSDVLPGITGWAQVNGRNALSPEQKVRYDNWYVNNITFLLDIMILYKTVIIVLRRENIEKPKKKFDNIIKMEAQCFGTATENEKQAC